MLIILLTIITSSAARTTYRPVTIENNSNHRTFLPVFDLNLNFGSSNGRQWIPNYSYPAVYDSVKLSEVLQGHSSNVHRRVNPQYSSQYPYESGNGQWNRRTVTEVPQLSDRFDNNRNEDDVFNYRKTQTTEKPEVIQYNRRVNYTKDINKQSHDVNINQHNTNNYTRQYQTTTEKVYTNFNRTNKPNVNIYNNSKTNHSSTNSYHSSIESTKNTDNRNKTNMFILKSDNNTLNTSNTIHNNNYTTKTTQENEVTSIHEARSDSNGDRWVWSNSVPETTTLVALDDRAAFAGGNCPTGTVRFQDRCIEVD